MSTWFDEAFAGQRAMAILRGYSAEQTIEYTERAWSLGIDLVEVPVQSDEAVEALRQLAAMASARGKFVGAGTVDRLDRVRAAADAGAVFTVAPGLDLDVAKASLDAGLAHLPGVATASEIQAAGRLGLNWVKAFPASVLGTAWFSAMHGPFPDLNLVATGGIDAGNAREFLAAGARVVALGSALADPAELGRLSTVLQD
jgi:2-dehydro-3-deoxyphosphogluconate aldolase/(4S)-4-hydroxy-2-oxoglutarate aldolase